MAWPFSRRQPAGYDDADLTDLVVRKTEVLRFGRIEDVVPGETLLPTLLAVANPGDRVLDFGGAAGLHYLAASRAYPDRKFQWAIVEHPLMVSRAKRFESGDLRFFTSVENAKAWLGEVDLLHSNSALQYLDEPEAMLARLIALKPRLIMWARMFLADERRIETEIAALRDHGPGPAPSDLVDRDVSLNTVRMDRDKFLAAHSALRLVWRSADSFLYADDRKHSTP